MNEEIKMLLFCGLLAFMLGLYLLLSHRNLIRIILGVEVLSKGITLILLAAGQARGAIPFIQSLVVTFIIVETVLAAVMLGLIVLVYKTHGSLDIRLLSKLMATLSGGPPTACWPAALTSKDGRSSSISVTDTASF